MNKATVMGWFFNKGEERFFTLETYIEPHNYEWTARQYAEANFALVKIFVDDVKVAESDSRPGETNE